MKGWIWIKSQVQLYTKVRWCARLGLQPQIFYPITDYHIARNPLPPQLPRIMIKATKSLRHNAKQTPRVEPTHSGHVLQYSIGLEHL